MSNLESHSAILDQKLNGLDEEIARVGKYLKEIIQTGMLIFVGLSHIQIAVLSISFLLL
jgi:hypothetical protein